MRWLDLKGASTYTSLSVRTLRKYIGDALHPLPIRVVGGKFLCYQADLDAWLRSFPRAGEEVDRLLDSIMKDVVGGET